MTKQFTVVTINYETNKAVVSTIHSEQSLLQMGFKGWNKLEVGQSIVISLVKDKDGIQGAIVITRIA